MLVHFAPGGRLGNQLFELAFIEAVRGPSERVFCTRMGPALRTLAGLRGYLNIDNWLFALAVDKLIEPVFGWLTRSGLISSRVEGEEGAVISKRGLLPVTYVRGYYQSAEFSQGRAARIRLRRCHVEAARAVLQEAGSRTALFIHVRRGDYLNYLVGGRRDPSLPLTYYREAVDRLLSEVRDPCFFFLGDEPEWAAQALDHLPRGAIRSRPAPVDLALMSLCDGGVASNSTFAWWGALLCRGGSPIIAPRYWLGWRSREWFPPRIASPHLQFIDVQ